MWKRHEKWAHWWEVISYLLTIIIHHRIFQVVLRYCRVHIWSAWVELAYIIPLRWSFFTVTGFQQKFIKDNVLKVSGLKRENQVDLHTPNRVLFIVFSHSERNMACPQLAGALTVDCVFLWLPVCGVSHISCCFSAVDNSCDWKGLKIGALAHFS